MTQFDCHNTHISSSNLRSGLLCVCVSGGREVTAPQCLYDLMRSIVKQHRKGMRVHVKTMSGHQPLWLSAENDRLENQFSPGPE